MNSASLRHYWKRRSRLLSWRNFFLWHNATDDFHTCRWQVLRHFREELFKQQWFTEKSLDTLLPYIDPHLKLPPCTRTKRKYDAVFHRLRLKLAFTGSFLRRIRQRESPTCEYGDPFEGVNHIPLECQRFVTERHMMKTRLGLLDNVPYL